jgi:hypothetical protein
MTNTIYIVDLESVPTRYTCQWKAGLPNSLREFVKSLGTGHQVVNISGGDVEMIATPGAFLNFAGTNVYKSNQAIEISKLFSEGKVRDGDRFLFTDAWNPAIIMVKYMVELLGIKAELHGIWHAGSYDPQDFLGRLVKDKRWSLSTENAIYHALDYNYFATNFHIKLFRDNVLNTVGFGSNHDESKKKMVLSGQPHEHLMSHLTPFRGMKKRDLILFPHRVAPEKQPEIFRDLATYLPEYEFVVCQDKQLTKDEYHTLLGECKMVFSANLQETLGISAMEGIYLDALALVPDRLSYSEMYGDHCKYPSFWTEDFNTYQFHRDELVALIREKMTNYERDINLVWEQNVKLVRDYLTGEVMYKNLTTVR